MAYRPSWPLLLLPVSLLAAVVGVVAGARHVNVTVPLSQQAVDRARRWARGTMAATGAALIGVVASAATHQPHVALAMVLVTVAALVVQVVANLVTSCGWWLDRTCTVATVTRCHPAFRDALGRGG